MKRSVSLIILLSGIFNMHGQIHEVGLFLGGSNFIGDVGSATYIAPSEPAFGLIYKWNRSPRHSWRASATFSKITGRDANSDADARKIRNYSFENHLAEVSLGMEFDFFKFDLHDSDAQSTLYIYSGLSYSRYNGLFFVDGHATSNEAHGSFAIPMVVGFKARILPHLVMAVETGPRAAFKDDLDGSNPANKNLEGFRFGNINSKDWYNFTGLTITYTYGNKPCFCTD